MLLHVAKEALDVLITVLLADKSTNKRATTHWLIEYMNKSTTNIPQHKVTQPSYTNKFMYKK